MESGQGSVTAPGNGSMAEPLRKGKGSTRSEGPPWERSYAATPHAATPPPKAAQEHRRT